MLRYILQLKNNMLSYIMGKEERNNFNKKFYSEVLEPLLIKINPIISNVYENGEGDKKDSGEEKSFFDLLSVMFNFIDTNTFVIEFYNQHIKNKNRNNEKIINTNEKINDGINNNEEIKGLLWRIGRKENNYL